MKTIANAYINSLLADASYVDLSRGVSSGDMLNDLTKRMTRIQAAYISANFEVISTINNSDIPISGSGFDATVWRGKTGSDYAGQVFVSMRGTEPLPGADLVADGSLATRGIPYEQIRDMANWWLKATTKAGDWVKQIKVDTVLPVNGAVTSIATYTFAADTEVKATGELFGQVNAIQAVNGHSLGGYLATAFTRLFGAKVQSVSTYNSAGFSDAASTNVKSEFDKVVSLLGIDALGTGSFKAAGNKQTNFRAGNGLSVTTNNWGEMPYWALGFNQYGEKQALSQEDTLGGNPIANHSMFKLTDYLALGAALQKLDGNLTFDKLNATLQAGSSDMKASYEGVLDAVRKMVQGPGIKATAAGDVGDNADSRANYHSNLAALQEDTTFKALAGKVTLSASAASASSAKIEFAQFLSVYDLSPFTLSTRDTTAQNELLKVRKDAAALWTEEISDKWWQDRKAMQAWVIQANTQDAPQGVLVGQPQDKSGYFVDAITAKTIKIGSGSINQMRNYFFGNEDANTYTGRGMNDALYGSGGNDTLIGLGGSDWLEGGAGNDVLDGGDGADVLLGGAGGDRLLGGDKDDYLVGGGDADYLEGGAGADTLEGGAGNDVYWASAGDTIRDSDGIGAIYFDGVLLDGGIRKDGATFFSNSKNSFLYASYGSVIRVFKGGDVLTIEIANAAPKQAAGESGKSTIIKEGGTSELSYMGITLTHVDRNPQVVVSKDVLSDFNETWWCFRDTECWAGAGNDWVYGDYGNDTLYGEDGDDHLYGDRLYNLYNASPNWRLDDMLFGGAGNDYLSGQDGNDSMYGEAGNDSLRGGLGNDYLSGGDGDDDLLSLGGADIMDGGNGNDSLWGTGELHGGDGNDSLSGQGGVDQLYGEAGNDSLDGWAGADVLYGGDGEDRLYGFDGEDTLYGGSGNDSLSADGGDDILYGEAGNDSLNGWAGYDLLYGGDGEDLLAGDNGDDVLSGGRGADTLNGGNGNDSYIFNLGDGQDVIDTWGRASSDTDILWFGPGILAENIDLSAQGQDLVMGLGGGDSIRVKGFYTWRSAPQGIDRVIFSDGVSWGITELISQTVWSGSSGNDSLYGLSGFSSKLYGFGGADRLYGYEGDDWLNGGAGVDTMVGDSGNDTYVVDEDGESISENANAGDDTVRSSVSWSLGLNLENLALTGTSAIHGTGNALDNILIGNSGANSLRGGGGNDSLDGGEGEDSLLGGVGDDTYTVDNTADLVTESAGEGSDTVRSSLSWTLGANLENLTLTGSAAIKGTGNALNNLITGNGASNSLNGGAGQDTLDGGGGADSLLGGVGDDFYVVDTESDMVTESADEGLDTVLSTVSWQLGENLENLTLSGAAAISGTGNDLNNVLTGDATANILDGGAGADTLRGGGGNDIYVVDTVADVVTEFVDGGVDTVRSSQNWALGENLENLTLTGSAALSGTGNALDNLLTGNSAANTLIGDAGSDTLDGGEGVDTLIGGLGDDSYVVDSAADVLTENADEGMDTVLSVQTWTLGAALENLTLLGGAAINGIGNALDNVITGNSAANNLGGGAGNDTFYDGGGADTVSGDDGDDLFRTTLAWEQNAFDGGAGNDSVDYSAQGYPSGRADSGFDGYGGVWVDLEAGKAWRFRYGRQLDDGVPDLLISIENATGSDLRDYLAGDSQGNRLHGLAGADYLNGGLGADTLLGGLGDDSYVVDNAGDVVAENANAGEDTVFSAISWVLSANLENLALTGAIAVNGTGNVLDNYITGNSAANSLIGGAGDDTLDGDAGADSLQGGLGDDIYVVDNTADMLTENASEGTDTVRSSLSWVLGANLENLLLTGASAVNGTGNALNNVLTGNSAANTLRGAAGNDTLDGGGGIDTLLGGAGDDTYMVDNAADVVTENASEGIDSVRSSLSWALGTNMENLALTGAAEIHGTGNAANNVLEGNSAANILGGGDGHDTLDGGAGADTLLGGAGDDTYLVDNPADMVTEANSEGVDTVRSSLSWVLGANLENLTLMGPVALSGTGNALNNVLTSNDAPSTLVGGAGDDRYVISNMDTLLLESADEGVDTVISTLNWILDDHLENLTLVGTAASGGTGNALSNVLTGNSAANSLSGGAGDDTLDGGTGADTLVGGAGNDTFYDAGGADTVYGGEGDDLIRTTLAWEQNRYDGGAGSDTVDYSVQSYNGIRTYGGFGGAGGIWVDLAAGQAWRYRYGAQYYDGIPDTLVSIENAIGSNLRDYLAGDAQANRLEGLAGDDVLNGGAGADTLVGGAGNDTYVVDSTDDVVTEHANEGTDTVQAAATYTLTANVENLTLTGSSAINGSGNALSNLITGNGAANVLDGGAGNDIFYDAGGADTVYGGEGDDLIRTTLAWEQNRYDGGAGSDTVDYSVQTYNGIRTYGGFGGSGGIWVDLAAGQAWRYRYGAQYYDGIPDTLVSIENAIGSNLRDYLVGDAQANRLEGLAGDDVLNGGAGADTLVGSAGNDTYVVDNTDDVVTENANEGTDTVQAAASYALTANVENLTLIGSAAINGSGDALSNVITGNGAANVLDGGAGNDTFYDAGGADTVYGGEGDDLIRTTLAWEQNRYDGGAGSDTVDYSVQTYNGSRAYGGFGGSGGVWVDLAAGQAWRYRYGAQYYDGIPDTLVSIENAIGSNLRDYLVGDAQANRLEGLAGDDVLNGGAGADTLAGGAEADTLYGGSGADSFVFNSAPGAGQADTVMDFSAADGDKLLLDPAVFAKLAGASSLSDKFRLSSQAPVGEDDYLVYNPQTGQLSYDASGNASSAALLIATLNNLPQGFGAQHVVVL